MNEIAKLVNKFSADLDADYETNAELTKMFLAALLEEARGTGSSPAFEVDEEDDEEGDHNIGTYYVNIEPRVEKVREVLEELSKLSSDKPKYA